MRLKGQRSNVGMALVVSAVVLIALLALVYFLYLLPR